MAQRQSSSRTPRGWGAGLWVGGVAVAGLVGLLWAQSNRAPSSSGVASESPAAGMKGEALERPAPSGAAAGEGFNLLGDALAPTERKLCSQAARRDMALFIDEIRDGEIVIREAEWKRKATSAQVGLASWLSHCTQDGRPLRIIGDESRAILALWDPGRGYVPVAEPR